MKMKTHLPNLLHINKKSLIWKTKHQKLRWYRKFVIERTNNKNKILEGTSYTSYDARISELDNRFLY